MSTCSAATYDEGFSHEQVSLFVKTFFLFLRAASNYALNIRMTNGKNDAKAIQVTQTEDLT